MLILIPVLLLLLAAIAIIFLRWFQPKFQYPWLIAAIAAMLSWISMCLLRFRLPTTLTVSGWQIGGIVNTSLGLLLDYSSWAYGLCISTLVLAVILTATARAQYQSDSTSWAGALAFGGLGLASVLAVNPISLLLSWVALDLINLGILLSNSSTVNTTSRALTAFGAQTFGTLFVMGAILLGHRSGEPFLYESIQESTNLFLLLGIALRLGMFPLHLPFSLEPRLRRGMGSLLRLIPIASVLMLLGRLPSVHLPDTWGSVLPALVAISALYCALMWINSTDEVEGRPYWIIASTALVLAAILNNEPQASLAWGIGSLLSGGLMFLYSARAPRLWFLWALGIWGFSGLPFSPTASGWFGLLTPGSTGIGLIFIVAQVLLILGYARHANQIRDPLDTMEPWVKTIYPLGLLFIPIAMILITIAGWHGSRTVGMVWPSLVGPSLVVAGMMTRILRPTWVNNASQNRLVEWSNPLIDGILQGINSFLRLNWLYNLTLFAYQGFKRLFAIITGILEGDGGVLWTLLLLTLVITLLQGRGATP